MSSTALVKRDEAMRDLVAQIRTDQFKQQIAIALPGNVTPERFVRATVTALMQTPDLVEATPDSIFQAVIRCAQDGLLPNGREAALVIFNVKVKVGNSEHWEKRAQYMPMIGGFRHIAAEYGWSLRTYVVYANDHFEHTVGLEPTLDHKPVRPGVARGEKIAAYAVAKHRDGRIEFEVMTTEEIERVRQVSKAKDSGPWRDWTDRMYEKTVGRRLFAKLPLDEADKERVDRVLAADTDPVTAIYGREIARETPALEQAPVPPDQPDDYEAGGSQQAGGAASGGDGTSTQAPSPAASPAPDSEPQGEPSLDDEPGFNAPTGASEDETILAAQQAAMFHPPNGQHKDRSLGEIHGLGDKGESWFKWALATITSPPEYVEAVWTFSRVYLPDLWQAAMAKKEAEAA